MLMLRLLLIVSLTLSGTTSWALNWGACHQQLEDLRSSHEATNLANNLATASYLAVKLDDLFTTINFKRYEYDQCKTSADGTPSCVYTQIKMNNLISKYKNDEEKFYGTISGTAKLTKSEAEPCGVKLNP